MLAIILMSLLAFSSCTTIDPGTAAASEAPATASPFSVARNSALSARQTGEDTIEIRNLSATEKITVYRTFIDTRKTVGELEPDGSLVDTIPWAGCSYVYSCDTTSPTGQDDGGLSITPAMTTESRRIGWGDLPSEYYKIKQVEMYGSESHVSTLHGVKVTVAFAYDVKDRLSAEEKSAFIRQCLHAFHRVYLLFGDFPLDEYKVICTDMLSQPVESLPGSTAGLALAQRLSQNRGLSNEPLSHQIVHAWIGANGAIHRRGTEDGWISEGMAHLLGMLVLDSAYSRLMGDFKERSYINHSDEPLVKMYGKYFQTEDAYSYYAKGGLLFWLVMEELRKKGVSYREFYGYLYEKYSTVPLNGPTGVRLITTSSLRADLAEKWNLDVANMYDPYVYQSNEIKRGNFVGMPGVAAIWNRD